MDLISERISFQKHVTSEMQGAVGDYTDSTGVNDLPVLNMIGHALVGGLAAEATGGEFASGAAAGFASAVAAQSGLYSGLSADQIRGLSQVIGGVAALVAGGDGDDVNAGAQIASSGALNNYLTHAQWKEFIRALKKCGSDGQCKEQAQESYYELSLRQQHSLAECGNDDSCKAPHLVELLKVRKNSNQLVAQLRALGGIAIVDDKIWALEFDAHGLLKGGQYYNSYAKWSSDNCSTRSDAGCYQAFINAGKLEAAIKGAKLGVASAGVALLGGVAVKFGPAALISARQCAANPVCWNQVGIAAAEIAAGDALGGSQISMTVATGGRLALQKGSEVIALVDDALGTVTRVGEPSSTLFKAADGKLYQLDNGGQLVAQVDSASFTLTQKQQNKLKHIFGKADHQMGPLADKFGSEQQAYVELEKAAEQAYKDGKLTLKADGFLEAATRIDVNGVEVDLLGGRVINGKFELGSASRRDVK